ncbi:hypothetical protein [Aquiflexum sp.]|uniref:hypothetical protein n=1 Tax=Aquiflexum sp. TaxID=1872584 RepID=UPI003593ED8D
MKLTRRILSIILIPLAWIILPIPSNGQDPVSENIFAHVSKNIAVAGERVWFAVSAIGSGKKVYSKIAYLELVDRNGQPVFQTMIYLENGHAEGYLDIPEQLQSDHYLLRFYTRISPFHGNSGVFNQFVTIINPNRPPQPQQEIKKTDTYIFQKPQLLNNSATLTAKKRSELKIPLPSSENSGTVSISISLSNPYLPDSYHGFIDGSIYKKPSSRETYIPEPFGHIIYTKNLHAVIDTTETFFVSAHGSQSVLVSAKPNLKGELFFELGALKDYNFLIAQSSNTEKQLNISTQSPFYPFEFMDDFRFPSLTIEEKDRPFLMNLIISSQIDTFFYPEKNEGFEPIVTGMLADITYLLDDYNRFEDIATTLKEYVPEVMVRKQSKKTLFKVMNKPLDNIFRENPLILIDAMPIFDADELATFNPEKIKKLDILTREFLFNKDQFAGVLSFTSFDNDFGGFELPENALYLSYPNIQRPMKLETPHFNDNWKESNYPDFRSSLYWNSGIVHTGTFGVFTSEITGDYEILISMPDQRGKSHVLKGRIQVTD